MSERQAFEPARRLVLVTGLVTDLSPARALLTAAGFDPSWQATAPVSGLAPADRPADPQADALFRALVDDLGLTLPDCCLPDAVRLRQAREGPLFRQATDYLEDRLAGQSCVAVVDGGFGWLPEFWHAAAAKVGARADLVVLSAPIKQVADDLAAIHGLQRPRSSMTWAAYHWRLMRKGTPGAFVFDHRAAQRFPRRSGARLSALLDLGREVALEGEAEPRRKSLMFAKAWRQQDQAMRPLARLVNMVRQAAAADGVKRIPVQPFESVLSFYCGLAASAPAVSIIRGGGEKPPEPAPVDATQPFFVLGAPRSGTTLLRNLLRQHPDLLAPEETHFFRWANPAGSDEFNNRYLNQPVLRRHRKIDDVPEADFRTLVEEAPNRRALMDGYAAAFRKAHAGRSPRWFDKSPQNVYGLPLIVASYPQSAIVHIHRHPVEVAASAMAGRSIARHSLRGATNLWLEPMQIIATLRLLLEDRLIELRYDDLVREPGTVMRLLGDALGLVRFRFDTAIVSAERGPQLYKRVMDAEAIAYVEHHCAAFMAAYGYSTKLPF